MHFVAPANISLALMFIYCKGNLQWRSYSHSTYYIVQGNYSALYRVLILFDEHRFSLPTRARPRTWAASCVGNVNTFSEPKENGKGGLSDKMTALYFVKYSAYRKCSGLQATAPEEVTDLFRFCRMGPCW